MEFFWFVFIVALVCGAGYILKITADSLDYCIKETVRKGQEKSFELEEFKRKFRNLG